MKNDNVKKEEEVEKAIDLLNSSGSSKREKFSSTTLLPLTNETKIEIFYTKANSLFAKPVYN
jgi:hypothetical protein